MPAITSGGIFCARVDGNPASYLRKKAKRMPVSTPIWPIQNRNIHWIRLARKSCISSRSLPISPDSSTRSLLISSVSRRSKRSSTTSMTDSLLVSPASLINVKARICPYSGLHLRAPSAGSAGVSPANKPPRKVIKKAALPGLTQVKTAISCD